MPLIKRRLAQLTLALAHEGQLRAASPACPGPHGRGACHSECFVPGGSQAVDGRGSAGGVELVEGRIDIGVGGVGEFVLLGLPVPDAGAPVHAACRPVQVVVRYYQVEAAGEVGLDLVLLGGREPA